MVVLERAVLLRPYPQFIAPVTEILSGIGYGKTEIPKALTVKEIVATLTEDARNQVRYGVVFCPFNPHEEPSGKMTNGLDIIRAIRAALPEDYEEAQFIVSRAAKHEQLYRKLYAKYDDVLNDIKHVLQIPEKDIQNKQRLRWLLSIRIPVRKRQAQSSEPQANA